MKNFRQWLFILPVFFLTFSVSASTVISTSSVSGHWTLAGSPYQIYNNIQVDSFNTLTIDPGVNVLFQGSYFMKIYGVLIASGNIYQPITFTVNDTTGWWTDNITGAGGWYGIQFETYTGIVPDSTTFEYCNISFTKIDSISTWTAPGVTTLTSFRDLSILHCTFNYNKVNPNANAGLIAFANRNIEVGFCDFSYNTANYQNILLDNYYGGSTYFHDNNVFNNQGIGPVIYGFGVNMLFENNELYANQTTLALQGNTVIEINGNYVTIRKNKIHDNINATSGAILCDGGNIDIIDNLICNNQATIGTCGIIEGGGGIKLSSNGTSFPIDSIFYRIRNNVIANNFAASWGGGIDVFKVQANISNNQIINNSTSTFGGAIHFSSDTFPIVIKNNIIYGNYSGSGIYSSIAGYSNSTIDIEHNFFEYPSYQEILMMGGTYVLTGDSTTNVIGSSPALIAPTLTHSATESALTANFGITNTSPCINRGDTTGAFVDSVDFIGNPRISGGIIDIGAYEVMHGVAVTQIEKETSNDLSIYPNPASNVIFVGVNEISGEIMVEDNAGKIVEQNKVSAKLNFIDIHLLPAGVYFVKWNCNGITKNTRKLVVE